MLKAKVEILEEFAASIQQFYTVSQFRPTIYERPVGLLVLLLIIHAGDQGSIPRANADHFYL